jgi:hypothetical protein
MTIVSAVDVPETITGIADGIRIAAGDVPDARASFGCDFGFGKAGTKRK